MADWDAVGTIELASDLVVRRLGFGGAWLTGPGTYGPPPDLDAARAALHAAVDAGVQLIDTADCYGPEVSETLIGETLAPYPDAVVVSTKGGRIALGDNQWRADGRPEAARYHASPAQIALAWLLQSSPATLPLPGTTRPDWIEEDLAALRLRLEEDELRELRAH